MDNKKNYYIKTNRTFNKIRKYGWIFTVMVAIGGLWEPKLGLLVIFIMAGLMITAFFSGRYWCGNFCPHGSLFDKIIMPFSTHQKIPRFIKNKAFVTAFFVFFMYNFGRKILNVMSIWGTYGFWDRLGMVFATTYLVVLIIGGAFALLVNPRTWCQFCPMGSIQKISHSLGKKLGVTKKTEKKVTITNEQLCHSCGKCSRVCPFQLTPYLDFSEKNQFDNANCIKCSTCVENCPAGILSLEKERDAITIAEKTSIKGYEERKRIMAKITDIVQVDESINEYTFSFITPEKVYYKAGQFILVKIQDEPKAYRAYSISSYNENNKTLKVIIQKVEKGYGTSKIFNNFEVGDKIELEGPMGDELVLDSEVNKVLFIANGIGITPFIGLVKDALLNYPNINEVKLLSGQRYEKQLLYHEYFQNFDEDYDSFQYLPVVSRDEKSSLSKGHVTTLLNDLNIEGYKVYMCGTKNMIIDSYNILLEKGVKESDIYYESEEKIKLKDKAV